MRTSTTSSYHQQQQATSLRVETLEFEEEFRPDNHQRLQARMIPSEVEAAAASEPPFRARSPSRIPTRTNGTSLPSYLVSNHAATLTVPSSASQSAATESSPLSASKQHQQSPDDLAQIRRENADLRHKQTMLQAQIDLKASLEHAHTAEIAQLKKRADVMRQTIHQQEEQLFLMQPTQNGHPSPNAHDDLAFSAANSQQSLTSLQQVFRATLREVQQEFAAMGATLRICVETEEAEANLLQEVKAISGNIAPTGALSPSASSVSSSALSAHFALDASILSRTDLTPADAPEVLEARGTKLTQAIHERMRIMHASIATQQQQTRELRRELQYVLQEQRAQSETVPKTSQQLELARAALQERDATIDRLTSQLSLSHSRTHAAETSSASTSRDVSSTLDALNAQIASLADQLAYASRDRQAAEKRCQALEDASTTSSARVQSALKAKDEEIAHLEQQLKQARGDSQQARQLGRSAEGQEAEITLLRNELATLRKLHTANSGNLLSIHNEINEKNMSLVALQTENLHLAQDNAKLESILTQAKEQAMLLSSKLAHFEQTIVPQMENENAALVEQLDALRKQLREMQSAAANRDREVQSLRADLTAADRDRSRSEEAHRVAESALAQLRSETSRDQLDRVELEVENQTIKARLAKERGRAEEIGGANQASVDALRQENQILSDHVNTTKQNLTSLQQQHEELQRAYKELLQRSMNASTSSTDHTDSMQQQFHLLQSQRDLQAARIAGKDSALTDQERRTSQLEAQLLASEAQILSLQAQISQQHNQNEDGIQTIQTLQHQVHSLQSTLQARSSAQGSFEAEVTNVLEEKSKALVQLADARAEVHAKTLQVSDGLELIHKLEAELAAFKLNVLLPYQRNHLDVGCEAVRMQQEVTIRNSIETEKSLQKQLRQREAQVQDLTSEIERTKEALESGNREWVTLVPMLKREKKALEEALDGVVRYMRDMHAQIAQAKRERRAMATTQARNQSAGGADAFRSSPFRPVDNATEKLEFGWEEEDADFDWKQFGLSASSPMSSSSGSLNTSNPSMQTPGKVHTALGFLLHDLTPLLAHYAEVLRTSQETEQHLAQTTRTHHEQTAQLENERNDLLRRLKQAESQLESLSVSHTRTQSEVTATINERLASQKSWEKERQQLGEQVDALERMKDQLEKRVRELTHEFETLNREYDAMQIKYDSAKRDLQRAQNDVKSLTDEVSEVKHSHGAPLARLQEAHSRAQEDLASWQQKFSDLARQLGDVEQEKAQALEREQRTREQHKEYNQRIKAEWDTEKAQMKDESEETTRNLRAQLRAAQEELRAAEEKRTEFERTATSKESAASKALTRTAEKLSAAESDLQSLQTEKEELTTSQTTLLREQTKLQSAVDTLTGHVESEREKARKLQKEFDRLTRESAGTLKDLQRESEVTRRALEKDLERHQVAAESAEREVVRLERALELSRQETKEAESRERAQAKALAAVERELAAKADALERTEKARQEEAKLSQEKVATQERAASRFQDALALAESRVREFEAQIATAQRSVSDLTARLHDADSERHTLQRLTQEQERKMRELDSEIASLHRAAHDSERRLHEALLLSDTLQREKVPRLETTISQLTQTTYERTTERDTLKKKVVELEYRDAERRSKSEQAESQARKDISALTMRLQSESDTTTHLRVQVQTLEREVSHRQASYQADLAAHETELHTVQQHLAKTIGERDILQERATKLESKLKTLASEYDDLTRSYAKSQSILQQLQSAITRHEALEQECRSVHVGQWEPMLERTKKEVVDLSDLVTQVRAETAAVKRQYQEALERATADHADELARMDRAYEQLRSEYARLGQEHAGALHEHLERTHTLQSQLESKTSDLERIRLMLGIEWADLLAMSENEALRERARSLFSGEAQLSIAQLHDLVAQQNQHLKDATAETVELNRVIERLKTELQAHAAQKASAHATMDKLLAANRRLQSWIDEQPALGALASRPVAFTPSAYVSRAASPFASPSRPGIAASGPASSIDFTSPRY